MATVAPHNLVTFRGKLGSLEMWQFSLHYRDAVGVANSTATCDALLTGFQSNLGTSLANYVSIDQVRIAPIGGDGKLAGEPSVSAAAPIKMGQGSNFHPFQVACAVSLRSNKVSGKGSHGRFYLPGPAVGVTALGNMEADGLAKLRTQVGQFLQMCNRTMAIQVGGSVSPILVSRGQTDYQTVTKWAVGDVLDTMRTRRGGLIEARAYQSL